MSKREDYHLIGPAFPLFSLLLSFPIPNPRKAVLLSGHPWPLLFRYLCFYASLDDMAYTNPDKFVSEKSLSESEPRHGKPDGGLVVYREYMPSSWQVIYVIVSVYTFFWESHNLRI